MFGNGAESKSKRVSLKKKYKIIRKVKEHHKKKAKEAKKLGHHRRKKVEKDPGIPNDWPFKEEELKALEARRARAIEELELKKAARKDRVCLSATQSLFPLHFILFLIYFIYIFSLVHIICLSINRYYHFFFAFYFILFFQKNSIYCRSISSLSVIINFFFACPICRLKRGS